MEQPGHHTVHTRSSLLKNNRLGILVKLRDGAVTAPVGGGIIYNQ